MISYFIVWLFDYITIIVTIILLLIYIYLFATSSHEKWSKLNVPHIRPLPIFGNTFKTFLKFEHQVETFDRIYKRFSNEKFCGFYQLKTPYLMLRDPALINKIMVQDFSYFTDHGVDTHPATNVMANSLFFLKGQRWKTMRKKLRSGFTSSKLKDTHDQINECSEQLMSRIREMLKHSDQIEVKRMMGNYSTDTIATCSFGMKLDTIKNKNSEFRIHLKKIFHRSNIKILFVHILLTVCPNLVKTFKFQIYPEDSSNFFYSVFNSIIKYRSEYNVIRNDLTQTLMQARTELVLNNDLADENKFTESDIIGNAISMFTSGSGTVTSTLAFCFYELALNKHVQGKLREEIQQTKIKYNEQFNYNFLTNLHYANQVLDETARMYSVTCTLIREATQTYSIPDELLVIEKGQKILIPMYNIHNDPKYYPNPHIFDPERFSSEQKYKRLNGTFIPFGDGPRICLGKRFAELEMIMVLSKVLSQYEVSPCDKTEIPIDIRSGSGFISPKNGIWLHFKPIVDNI